MKRTLAALLAAACAAGAVPAEAQSGNYPKSDWEREQEARNWREGEVKLPPFPSFEQLIEFPVGATSSFRFYVDPASLTVSEDGVVRYTLVARSPSGVDNVSFEGIRCSARTHKVYAHGRQGGVWAVSARAEWQPTGAPWARALRREFFCPHDIAVASAAEGVEALRRGRHPLLLQESIR